MTTIVDFRPGLSDRIAIAIRQAGLTQTAVAEQMNVKPSTVSRWTSGRVRPDLDSLVTLADVTGAEWLLDLRDTTIIDDMGKRHLWWNGVTADQTCRIFESCPNVAEVA